MRCVYWAETLIFSTLKQLYSFSATEQMKQRKFNSHLSQHDKKSAC